MNEKQRDRLSDKLANLGNLTLVALFFSQLLSERGINWSLAIGGLLFAFLCYLVSITFLK